MLVVDNAIYGAGIAGIIGGLLWRGILPYLLARKKAEEEGLPPTSFEKSYMTTMIISFIGGLIAVFMAIETFEKSIANVTSIMFAAGLGFSFVYTVLGIANDYVDLRKEKTELSRKIKTITKDDNPKE